MLSLPLDGNLVIFFRSFYSRLAHRSNAAMRMSESLEKGI